MAERDLPDFSLPSDAERARDQELLAALHEHESVGERYARSGAAPETAVREPPVPRSTGDDTPVALRDPTPVESLARTGRSVWRRVLQVGAVLFALAVAYFLITLWQVWSTGRSDQARPVDAIVVMGAAQYDGRPSPQLAARLDHVVELWPQGFASTVIVTGGKQPGDRFTEAEASADYLIAHGVPEDAIVQEASGASTHESLERVADYMEFTGQESVLIVTDPYHALRSRLIAQELGLTAYVSPTDDSVVTGARQFEREVAEAAGISLGRIISFDRLSGLTD